MTARRDICILPLAFAAKPAIMLPQPVLGRGAGKGQRTPDSLNNAAIGLPFLPSARDGSISEHSKDAFYG